MATQNRDQERLYPPGKLSNVFAVASTLLLLVMVWMLWQDYDRPWKDYQKSFRSKQLEIATQKAKHLVATTPDLAELEEAAARAQARLEALDRENPELQALRERLPGLQQTFDDAEAAEKSVKGNHAPARYGYELAVQRHAEGHVSAGHVADALDTLNRWASEWYRANQRVRQAQADLSAVSDRLAEIRKPFVDDVKKTGKRKELLAREVADLAVAGLSQRFDRNTWRNWMILDILSRSIEIKQVVLKDIHDNWNFATSAKVDRCMTCHLGVDQPDMGDESIARIFEEEIQKAYGEDDPEALTKFKAQHGFERWMQPHPANALISGPASVHPVEKVGCTVCHAGVGWSTDFSRAAHTPLNHDQQHMWQDRHDWKPPEFVDYPMLLREYVQGQCFKCHKQGFGWPVPYLERLDHGGVFFDAKRKVWAPLPQTFTDVDGKVRQLEPFELFGKNLRLPEAPDPVDGPRSEVARVQRALEQERLGDLYHPSMVRGYDWDAEAYDLGEESIIRYGCQGCHKIEGFGEQVGSVALPRVGPELSYLADKVKPEWLERWIKHPDAFRIDTRMPSFFWYVPKNDKWKPVDEAGEELPAGERRPVTVLESHLFDRDEHLRAIGPLTTPDDVANFSIQVRAMTLWLLSQGRSRADPNDPEHNPAYAKDPLPGDPQLGREVVGNEGYGCVACHIVPEVKDASGAWVPDDGARFRNEPAKGPRLTGLGSKFRADGRALNAWLARPRHYTATTSMPDMRWRDETRADGTVVRTAEQVRANVVAYLLSQRDLGFEALPGVGWDESWNPRLRDMYEEFFGRDEVGRLRRASEVEGELKGLGRDTALARMGERLMSRNGCFGCHAVKGHEEDQPIGTELSWHGTKDLHQLDFGYVHAVPHSRAAFLRTKITHPRVWDAGRTVRWTDRLRMPRFNFRMDDGLAQSKPGRHSTRAAVAGILLGLVKEPLQEGALYKPDAATLDVIRFRRVVQRYGCDQCHVIEGQASVLWRFLRGPLAVAPGESLPEGYEVSGSWDMKLVPPDLFGEGHRAQADWLQDWLRDPYDLRPKVRQRMPKFELDQAEADALVAGFQRLAGLAFRVNPQPKSRLEGRDYAQPLEIAVQDAEGKTVAARSVRSALEEAEFLFDTINCNKCHLPLGSPGADPTEGGVAPPLKYAPQRLGRDWVNVFLKNPAHLSRNTAMPKFWQPQGYGRQIDPAYAPFQFGLRNDPAWQRLWTESKGGTVEGPAKDEATKRLADAQADALADYVVHHYRWPRPSPAEPR